MQTDICKHHSNGNSVSKQCKQHYGSVTCINHKSQIGFGYDDESYHNEDHGFEPQDEQLELQDGEQIEP